MAFDRRFEEREAGTGSERAGVAPGKRTRTEALPVQRKAAVGGEVTGGGTAPAVGGDDPFGMHLAGSAVGAAAGGVGSAPADHVRSRVEQVTGADLGGVRIHDGAASDAAARSLSARAYTVGQDIHFAAGEHRPGTTDGDHLLAHELAHTVQQGATAGPPQCQLEVSQPGDAAEVEADAVADAAMRGGDAVPVQRRTGVMLHRAKITGNTFGDWDLTQVNTNGANKNASYASEINLKFSPKANTVNSTEIAFLQNVRTLDVQNKPDEDRDSFKNRMTDEGFTIDRVEDRKNPFYGYNNDGSNAGNTSPGSAPNPLKDATLYDKPSWNHPNTKWEFETAAVAKAGTDKDKVYGALTWGFDVDKDNKVTSHQAKHTDKQSGSFDKAVTAWNDQAKGPENKRNHKDQLEIAPLK